MFYLLPCSTLDVVSEEVSGRYLGQIQWAGQLSAMENSQAAHLRSHWLPATDNLYDGQLRYDNILIEIPDLHAWCSLSGAPIPAIEPIPGLVVKDLLSMKQY